MAKHFRTQLLNFYTKMQHLWSFTRLLKPRHTKHWSIYIWAAQCIEKNFPDKTKFYTTDGIQTISKQNSQTPRKSFFRKSSNIPWSLRHDLQAKSGPVPTFSFLYLLGAQFPFFLSQEILSIKDELLIQRNCHLHWSVLSYILLFVKNWNDSEPKRLLSFSKFITSSYKSCFLLLLAPHSHNLLL